MTSSTNISSLPQDITAYQLVPQVLPTPIWLIDKNWANIFALFIQKEASTILCSLPSRRNSNLCQFLNHKIVLGELSLQNCFPSLIKVMEVFNVQPPKKLLSIEEIDCSSQQIEDKALKKIWLKIVKQIHDLGIPMPSNDNAEEIRSWMLQNKAHLQTITKLNLSNLSLAVLPVEIGYLTGLRQLNLEDNKLRTLPREIGQLGILTKLNLQHNQLTCLPVEIGKLTSLTHLNLGLNKLTDLPAEIGQLINLRGLCLSDNKFTCLPSEIGQLTSLTWFDLSDNKLTDLPMEIGQLTSLTFFALSDNKLTDLPLEIGQLKSLTFLKLSNNQLAHLPGEIGQLMSLAKLHLNNNQLTHVPREIGQLTNLCELVLFKNRLTHVPVEIRQLKNLSYLHLGNNQLTTFDRLPLGIRNLSLDANPILFVSEEILNSSCFESNSPLQNYKAERDYLATSDLALLYQSLLKREDLSFLKAAFYRLSKDEQNLIYGLVWELSGKPIGDPQWGEHHAFDDMRILGLAVRKMIVTKAQNIPEAFARLKPEVKARIYKEVWILAGKPQTDDLHWGEHHAFEESNRLILAITIALSTLSKEQRAQLTTVKLENLSYMADIISLLKQADLKA